MDVLNIAIRAASMYQKVKKQQSGWAFFMYSTCYLTSAQNQITANINLGACKHTLHPAERFFIKKTIWLKMEENNVHRLQSQWAHTPQKTHFKCSSCIERKKTTTKHLIVSLVTLWYLSSPVGVRAGEKEHARCPVFSCYLSCLLMTFGRCRTHIHIGDRLLALLSGSAR